MQQGHTHSLGRRGSDASKVENLQKRFIRTEVQNTLPLVYIAKRKLIPRMHTSPNICITKDSTILD